MLLAVSVTLAVVLDGILDSLAEKTPSVARSATLGVTSTGSAGDPSVWTDNVPVEGLLGVSPIIEQSSEPTQIVSGTERLPEILSGSLVSTRMPYWKFGIDKLAAGDWLWGSGFEYQAELSCEIKRERCSGYAYPHQFILSHGLSAGLLGLISSLAILVLLALLAWRGVRSDSHWVRAYAILLLCVAGYSTVSGDTMFALPAFCALPALLLNIPPARPAGERWWLRL